MPEGDTLHHAAKRVGAALVGSEILSIETPHPRHRMDRWPERLAGRGVRPSTPAASTCSSASRAT